MGYRVLQWATGNVGRAAIEGVLAASGPRAGWLLGAWGGQGRPGRRHPGRARPDRDHRHARRRRLAGARRRLRRLQPDLRRPRRRHPDPRIGQERRDAAGLVLPADRGAPAPRRRLSHVGGHPARHRHPPRGDHRAVPAHGLGPVGLHHPGAGGGVLRHPHLRRPRRHPRLDAVRQDPRGVPHEHHGRRARRRVPAVGVDGRRRAGLRPRPQLRTTHEMAVATAPIDSPIGPIAPGLVAAQRFRWEGLVDGEP